MAEVTVRGDDIMKPPLYEGDAKYVVIRDSNGVPGIALIKVATDTWGICKKTDDDWESVVKRFGIK